MAAIWYYRLIGLSRNFCSLLDLIVRMEVQDVYTDSGMKRKGNDFPLQEVLRVSQVSRQLWLNQRPFKLKRGQSRHPSSCL